MTNNSRRSDGRHQPRTIISIQAVSTALTVLALAVFWIAAIEIALQVATRGYGG